MLVYHAATSRGLVLQVEICLAVIVVRVPPPSMVGILPPFAQREFLILHPQHFLLKYKSRRVEHLLKGSQATAQIHQKHNRVKD